MFLKIRKNINFILVLSLFVFLLFLIKETPEKDLVHTDPKKWVWEIYREKFGAFFAQNISKKDTQATMVLSKNKNEFINIDKLIIRKVLPQTSTNDWWSSWDNNEFIWWGARTLLINSDEGKEKLLSIPYLSGKFGDVFSKFISLVDLSDGKQTKIHLSGKELITEITGDGEYTPTSINAFFNRTNGNFDFILGNRLIQNISLKTPQSINIDDFQKIQRDSVFLKQNNNAPLLAFREESKIFLTNYHKNDTVRIITLPDDFSAKEKYYPTDRSISFLSDIDLDGNDELVVKSAEYILIFLSQNVFSTPPIKIIGDKSLWRAKLGATGDFNRDGFNDFWVVIRHEEPGTSRSFLVSGKDLTSEYDIRNSYCELIDSKKYSDTDGLGSTISPIAGDFDQDGIPDFSIGGHFHMSWNGALYILPGKHLKSDCKIPITSKKVVKILGEPFSELVPTGFHYDYMDINKDNYSDIILTADNDLEAGFSAGALYILDGKKISALIY